MLAWREYHIANLIVIWGWTVPFYTHGTAICISLYWLCILLIRNLDKLSFLVFSASFWFHLYFSHMLDLNLIPLIPAFPPTSPKCQTCCNSKHPLVVFYISNSCCVAAGQKYSPQPLTLTKSSVITAQVHVEERELLRGAASRETLTNINHLCLGFIVGSNWEVKQSVGVAGSAQCETHSHFVTSYWLCL